MVLLLVGAAVISLAIGELLDAAVILAIVVANAIFGAVQEGRAEGGRRGPGDARADGAPPAAVPAPDLRSDLPAAAARTGSPA